MSAVYKSQKRTEEEGPVWASPQGHKGGFALLLFFSWFLRGFETFLYKSAWYMAK